MTPVDALLEVISRVARVDPTGSREGLTWLERSVEVQTSGKREREAAVLNSLRQVERALSITLCKIPSLLDQPPAEQQADLAGTVAYEEPSLSRLLTLLSFLYLLQVARHVANKLVGAGLLGEIALGIVYSTANILPGAWEETFLVLGYLGLVLIVFEGLGQPLLGTPSRANPLSPAGGLDFDEELFLPSLPLATIAALTGVLLPLAFTFALFYAFSYPTIDALAAGAALASTSLGTTFYVLRAQSGHLDLASTRIGTILVGAALIDDIIALVLLSVIKELGDGSVTSLGWTVGRPVLASVAMAILGPVVAFFVARPLFGRFGGRKMAELGRKAELFIGVCVLSAFLAMCVILARLRDVGADLGAERTKQARRCC